MQSDPSGSPTTDAPPTSAAAVARPGAHFPNGSSPLEEPPSASSRACASTGAPALLVPAGARSSSLVLARPGSRLPSTLSLFGCETRAFHVADPGASEPTRAGPADAPPDCADTALEPGSRIPAVTGSVDLLFLEAGLRVEGSRGGREAARRLFGECQRVLRPGGTLVLVQPNPLALPRLLGRGRRLSAEVPPAVGRGPKAVRRFLECNGFDAVRMHIPWPAHGELGSVVCRASANRAGRFEARGRGRAHRAAGECYRILQRVGLHLPLVPELYLVARRRGPRSGRRSMALRPSALGRILSREAPSARIHELVMGFRRSTNTLTFRAGRRFVKVPLTPDGLSRLGAEEEALRRLLRHRLADHTLVATRFARSQGVPYVSAPFIRHEPDAGWALEPALRMMAAAGGEFRPLSDTATWRRVARPPPASPWSRIAGGTALAELLRGMGSRRVPAGLSHGDFHEENLLVDGERVFIIDWDRLEEPAPLFIDPLSAFFYRLRRPTPEAPDWRAAYLAVVDRLMDPDSAECAPMSMRAHAGRLLGELEWREAAAFYVAAYAERWATSTVAAGTSNEATVRSVCQDRFERCVRWLGGG